MGKIRAGIADDLLSTVLTAVELGKCPVILAPSMNTTMLENPAVKENIRVLEERGFFIADPGKGDLACGETGNGRMVEPFELLEMAGKSLSAEDYQNVTVLISAGPAGSAGRCGWTNHSSGKMGYALARAARERR